MNSIDPDKQEPSIITASPADLLKKEIQSFLQSKMESIPVIQQNVDQLTIGLEHECFLVDAQGQAAKDGPSQEFMNYLSRQPGWTASESFKFDAVGDMAWRVSRNDSEGKVTSVRYRHHPHHLEILTPMFKDLHEVKDCIEPLFELLNKAASLQGLKLLNEPILNVPSFHPSVNSQIPHYADIRKFRTKLYLRQGEAVDSEAVNHPAIVSSTKTVVGGINWFKNPKIIHNLYLIEPKILTLTTPRRTAFGSDVQQMVHKRWSKLIAPYKYSPLVGFPRIVEWNLESWIDALLRAPLMGPGSKEWSARTLMELGQSPFGSPSTLLSSMRELQMIYPGFQGTVTFQADPSPVSIKNIMALMALRLGLSSVVCMGLTSKSSFMQAEKEWKNKISGVEPLKAVEAPAYFAAADKGLKFRKQAEDKYLVLM